MDYSLIELDLEETPDGEVYFIFMKDDDRKCKIGKSDNPKKRTSQLQTGNPYELYVYKTLRGYDRLERMLHKHFVEYRIRKTEWFDITFRDVDKIIEQYNQMINKIISCDSCGKKFATNNEMLFHINNKKHYGMSDQYIGVSDKHKKQYAKMDAFLKTMIDSPSIENYKLVVNLFIQKHEEHRQETRLLMDALISLKEGTTSAVELQNSFIKNIIYNQTEYKKHCVPVFYDLFQLPEWRPKNYCVETDGPAKLVNDKAELQLQILNLFRK